MGAHAGLLERKVKQSAALRVFRHRDFRLLWGGAFLSFVGSWIQNIAQGWLVFELTHDAAKLAFVTFCSMMPTSLFGPFAGVLTDMLNRRVVLVITQAIFGAGALFLAAASFYGFIQYWHIVVVALVSGFASTVEIPTRQSLVSQVVPPEDLAAAVPLNAMTFNLARVLGPSIGAILLTLFGAATCYLANGLSYLALIVAVLVIRADLSAAKRVAEPISDLLLAGVRYTLRDRRLRTLFLMEVGVSTFGLFYLPLMPAVAKSMLGLDKTGLGLAMTFVGIGAMLGLVSLMALADKPVKTRLVGFSMAALGASLMLLSFVRSPAAAFPLLAVAGMAGVVQFNCTNTLFQLLSPPELRGRVLAMHVWALSGLNPFGTLFFGWFAKVVSMSAAMQLGGGLVLAGATVGWLKRKTLEGAE